MDAPAIGLILVSAHGRYNIICMQWGYT